MSLFQYILGIVMALLTFAIVIEMLRRRRLRERHAGWWLVAGLIAVIISIFPNLLETAAVLVGFDAPVNLVFFVSLFVLFLVALQHSAELTRLEAHNRAIVERLIILELRLEKADQSTSSD